MKPIRTVSAALLALSVVTGTAAAMPQTPAVEGDGLVTKVQVDCHADVRRHYLPEYGRRVYHKHIGERCRIRVYNRHQGGGSGQSCVKLGPITVCED